MRAMGINTIREMIAGAAFVSSLLTGVFSVFSFAVIYYYSVQLGLLATLMAAIIIGVTSWRTSSCGTQRRRRSCWEGCRASCCRC